MNDGLPTFREGFAIAPQLTARALNAMVAAIRRNRVTPGPNQLLDQSSGGTQVWERRGRSPIVPHPFYPSVGSAPDKLIFEPGIITNAGRNISPTVGGGATMASLPRPELTVTTTGTAYLEATVDGAGAATAIDTKNAATTPTDTATLKHLTLATVTLTAGVVTVTDRPVRESRSLYLCNGTAIWD